MTLQALDLNSFPAPVSPFVLGTIPLARLEKDEATGIILHGLNAGINVIDTARAYGPAEDFVGAALAAFSGHRVFVMTKSMRRDGDGLRRELETSLGKLGRDSVDVFFLHQVDAMSDLEVLSSKDGAYHALLKAREEGLVQSIGISGHFTPVLEEAVARLELDILLGRFNLAMVFADYELIKSARACNLDIATMKVFEGGFVTRHTELALRFAIHQVDTDLILLGCDSRDQIDRDLAAFEHSSPLGPDETSRLEAAAEALRRETFCSYCGYCVDVCPLGIPVSHIFNFESKLAVYGDEYGFAGSPGAETYLADMLAAIDTCTSCGACEKRCPNRLEIRKLLAQRKARFTAYLHKKS